MNLQNDLDKTCYALGLNVGAQLSQFPVEIQLDALCEGIRDMVSGKEAQLSREESMALLDKLFHKMNHGGCNGSCHDCHGDCHDDGASAEENLKAGQAYREENGKKEGVVTTASGLQIQIHEPGQGRRRPGANDVVKVHYTGRLIDGTVFDSSVERGEPIEFSLDHVIPGWTEGMQSLGIGGKATLVIPPELGYGESGVGGVIPPQATLIFDVELLDIR